MAGEHSADDRRSEVRRGALGKRYGTRHQRRAFGRVEAMLHGRRMSGRPLGRARGKTGQPAHFVEWQRIAAEARLAELAAS